MDPQIERATKSHQTQAKDPEGGAGDVGEDAQDLDEYPINVDLFSTVTRRVDAEEAQILTRADRDAQGTNMDAAVPERFPRLQEGETARGVGDTQHAPSIPSLGDIPMLDSIPPDPSHHPSVTDECTPNSLLILEPIVIPSSPPPPRTFPGETRQSPAMAPVMNVDVTDDTL